MVLGDTFVSPLDWRALSLGRIPPPAIGALWGKAETRRAPPPPPRTWDGMATAGQREVARCPRPVQHLSHVCPGQKTEFGFLFPPKTTRSRKPHRPEARLADMLGDAGLTRAGLTRAGQGERVRAQTQLALWFSVPLPDGAAESEAGGGSQTSVW